MDFYGEHRHPPPFEKSALIRPGLFSLYYIFSHPAAALSETALHVYDVNYEHLREYNTILSRIGNNLNQIAKRMNATGNVYEADIKEVKELMKQVWQSQKSMLSKQPSIRQ